MKGEGSAVLAMTFFSPAQLVGYVALLFGVSAVLQKNDRHLKQLLVVQSFSYVLHFVLLGNFPASGSAGISCLRNLLSLRTRSPWLAAVFIAANLAIGAVFAQGVTAWFPVVGSCFATVAVFTLQGLVLRVVLLFATLFWLANNILSGSVGGMALETLIALVNVTTILRMVGERKRLRSAA